MQDELQAAAEALAAELGRSAYIEAPAGFVPLAVSTHYGAVDKARIDALLARAIAPELLAYYKQWHLDAADKPVRIRGNESLGLLPRVVYPVRHNGQLLAHVWLVDADPPITETDDAAVARASRAIGRILFRRDEKTQQRAEADESTLRTLLREDLAGRQEALEEALRRRDIAAGGAIAILVAKGITVASTGCPVTSDALKSFASDLGATSGGTSLIPAAWTPELVALAPVRGDTKRTAPGLARVVRSVGARHNLRFGGIGLGSAVPGVAGLAASYRHGQYCARVNQSLDPHEGCKDWDDLGKIRMFAEIPWTLQGIDMVHPGLSRLFDDERSPLPMTLWTYLQCGGDVQETSGQLNMHRGTMYYRLGRTEEILGLRLGDGETRLSLHAGLLLAKLAGLLDPGNAP
ncbi:PucR family transcriptional regulator [Pseudarthrobacter cellobiosi]|uniref:PucR family transcriptional regulator n=1 Tax=Pseudarthrobacter cellobiosi TaxID=2953654 RepID=UPI00208FC81F|nr:helix-turn-helix domain-containing protein [Pseudarthrobacter sp. HLT1-5]MCO4253734.1 helix-turn-helix domain-containing protein [Pseudarthrobacter sp. HLT1-5]